jgi:MoaA/NifB/PqqE/SkfB family radical SAM enzyme
MRFWSGVPGVDQVRIKEDETNMMHPDAGHAAEDWKHPCHYLWRGPMYVKQNGDVYPCCQSYMLDGAPLGNIADEALESIWNGTEMQRMRRRTPAGGPARSTFARAAALRFRIRRWWRAACYSMARRCAACCRRSSG